jgi:hypothetical protein
MNWKGFGRKRSWPVEVPSQHELEKATKNVNKASGLAEIRTELLPNTSLKWGASVTSYECVI